MSDAGKAPHGPLDDQPLDRIEGSIRAPIVSRILIDGRQCFVREAELLGSAVAMLDRRPVVTIAMARTWNGLQTGLYVALTADEARRLAASLVRSAGLAEQPAAGESA